MAVLSIRSREILSSLGFAICLLYPSPSFAEGDPLPHLEPSGPGRTACFRRVYDGEHLRRHPEQATVAVTLSLRRDKGDAIESRTFRLALQQKGCAQALYGWGACWWEAKANLDSEGRRLVPAFRSDDAVRCMGIISPESAEEAGEPTLQPTPDWRALLLDTRGSFTLRKESEGAWDAVTFGPTNRLFRLDRVDAAQCRVVEAAFPLERA